MNVRKQIKRDNEMLREGWLLGLEDAAKVAREWGEEQGHGLMPQSAAAWHIEKAIQRRARLPQEEKQ